MQVTFRLRHDNYLASQIEEEEEEEEDSEESERRREAQLCGLLSN